jgi:3-deoxy-D-manno-octulosonic-acid transferase
VKSRPSLIYRLTLSLAEHAAPFAARWDKKVARGLEGRRGLLDRLQDWARSSRDAARPLVWVHAPSVGEGLQAKPVLESLRARRPGWQLAYTFFSPSAERLARTLPVDVTDFVPLDRPREVRRALELLAPTALVFSKLDVWPELTLAAAARGVRLGLISATVSPDSSRLRWPVRAWAAPAYRALERIGAISDEDAKRLEQLGAREETIQVTGDTRYDSVAERAARFDKRREPFARLLATGAGRFTIVAGSTWPADEHVVLPAFADLLVQVPHARLILAPHEPHPDHLAGIATLASSVGLPRPVRLSQLEHVQPGAESPRVIVVDRVGILADLYAVGDVAFVGGGFHRAGLHSVLEPAVFGVPAIMGPHWQMSRDAALLLERRAAFALGGHGASRSGAHSSSAVEASLATLGGPGGGGRDAARHGLHAQWLVWHHDPAGRRAAGAAGKNLVMEGRGAADRTTTLVEDLVG